MSGPYEDTAYRYGVMDIVHTSLVGLMFLVGLCLCCLSCCFTNRKGDKERGGVVFFKVAWVLFEMFVLALPQASPLPPPRDLIPGTAS